MTQEENDKEIAYRESLIAEGERYLAIYRDDPNNSSAILIKASIEENKKKLAEAKEFRDYQIDPLMGNEKLGSESNPFM